MKGVIIALLILTALTSCIGGKIDSVKDYLRSLPSKDLNKLSAYSEEKAFKQISREDENISSEEKFDALIFFYENFPESEYELYANFFLAENLEELISKNPSYVVRYYQSKYDKDRDGDKDSYISDSLRDMGIEEVSNTYTYNGIHYKNVANYKGYSPLKAKAYYKYILYFTKEFEESEVNHQKYYDNMEYLSIFANRFPSSKILEEAYTNSLYYPHSRHSISAFSYSKRQNIIRWKEEITSTINELKSNTNYIIFATGNKVRVRDRLPSYRAQETVGVSNDVYSLDNYETARVVRETRQYDMYMRKYFYWALLEIDGTDGVYTGWVSMDYILPISNASTNDTLIKDFSAALKFKNERNYIEAANAFSKFIMSYNSNYFTDKAYYLLWEVNGIIGVLTRVKKSKYTSYVASHPLYYVYDVDNAILRPSNLIYEALLREAPNSEYIYRVNNTVILD